MKNKLFPGITVEVACLPDCEKDVANVFWDCLTDYCLRFNTSIANSPTKICICAIDNPIDDEKLGTTIFNSDDNRILVQIKDPFISECDFSDYSMMLFIQVLCHEFIHVAQYLTGRKGIRINKISTDKTDRQEKYFFDPAEIEARILESPYSIYYGHRLL